MKKVQSTLLQSAVRFSRCTSLSAVVVGSLLVGGCSVGWAYTYGGHDYKMSTSNIDYHKKVLAELHQMHGDVGELARTVAAEMSWPIDTRLSQLPKIKADIQKLVAACQFLRNSASASPDGGGFTSARALLEGEFTGTCTQAIEANTDISKSEVEAESQRLAIEAKAKSDEEAAARTKRNEAIERIVRHCETRVQAFPCAVDGVTESEKSECEKRCSAGVSSAVGAATRQAATSCADAVKANRRKKPSCDVQLPEGTTVAPARIPPVSEKLSPPPPSGVRASHSQGA